MSARRFVMTEPRSIPMVKRTEGRSSRRDRTVARHHDCRNLLL